MGVSDRSRDNGDPRADFQIQIGRVIRSVEVGWLPRYESALRRNEGILRKENLCESYVKKYDPTFGLHGRAESVLLSGDVVKS